MENSTIHLEVDMEPVQQQEFQTTIRDEPLSASYWEKVVKIDRWQIRLKAAPCCLTFFFISNEKKTRLYSQVQFEQAI